MKTFFKCILGFFAFNIAFILFIALVAVVTEVMMYIGGISEDRKQWPSMQELMNMSWIAVLAVAIMGMVGIIAPFVHEDSSEDVDEEFDK